MSESNPNILIVFPEWEGDNVQSYSKVQVLRHEVKISRGRSRQREKTYGYLGIWYDDTKFEELFRDYPTGQIDTLEGASSKDADHVLEFSYVDRNGISTKENRYE